MSRLLLNQLDQSARGRRERRQRLNAGCYPKTGARFGCEQNNPPSVFIGADTLKL